METQTKTAPTTLALRFSCPACRKGLKVKRELAAKRVKCPGCGKDIRCPAIESSIVPTLPSRRYPLWAGLVLSVAILACGIYANLAFAVTDPTKFIYFPPFKANHNTNGSRHLGGEYYQIAKSIVNGEGFSHPFDGPTGPTAWQPPVLPFILAGLLWICDGERDAVMAVVVFFQVEILIGTGLLVLAVVWKTTNRLGVWLAAAVYFAYVLCDFKLCFQLTHDYWLVLLFVDLLLAGLCWLRPLRSWRISIPWGVFGGFCALVNPMIGACWALLSGAIAVKDSAWRAFALALLGSLIVVAPWSIRNYLVLGRPIPTKSNLAFELYQSQCLQRDGLLQNFAGHPFRALGKERLEYERLGEVAFMDRKMEQFWQSVSTDPLDFLDRVARRFLAATLWWTPFNRTEVDNRPWVTWINRMLHPLPFLALIVLLFTCLRERLPWSIGIIIGVYVLYLLPYIVASYYDRYAIPLIGVKAMLVTLALDRAWSMWQARGAVVQRPSSLDAAGVGA